MPMQHVHSLRGRRKKKKKKREKGKGRGKWRATKRKRGSLTTPPLYFRLFFYFHSLERHRPSALCTPMIYTRKIHLRKLWPTLVAIAQRPDPIVNLATERASRACAASGLSVIVLMAK